MVLLLLVLVLIVYLFELSGVSLRTLSRYAEVLLCLGQDSAVGRMMGFIQERNLLCVPSVSRVTLQTKLSLKLG